MSKGSKQSADESRAEGRSPETPWPQPPSTPRYYKEAFHNVFNYTLLGGGLAASALTLNPLPALLALGVEGLWLAVGTEIPAFKRLVERRHDQKLKTYLAAQAEARAEALPGHLRDRYRMLEQLRDEIYQLWDENPSLARSLLTEQVQQLQNLLYGFLDLAEGWNRLVKHLDRVNVKQLEAQILRQRSLLQNLSEGTKREVLEQELRVLEGRQSRLKLLAERAEIALGQMSLLHNTFLLLKDELVAPGAPTDVRERLSSIMEGVGTAQEALTMVEELEA